MKVGVDADLGMDYLTDFEERYDETARDTVGTDWDCINELMNGGLGPGELGVVVAPSGVGKTWVLAALGAAAVKAGKTVAHYTLELSQGYVGLRYDTVFTHIASSDLSQRRDEVLIK